MELGNLLFGNSRGSHRVNRDYQDEFVEKVLNNLGFDGYGIPNDETLVSKKGFIKQKDGAYTNGLFTIFPYWWGDCTCGAEDKCTDEHDEPCQEDCKLMLPNFIHHPSEFVLQWYKYALRDSYSNHPFNDKTLSIFIDDANKLGILQTDGKHE